MITCTSLGKEYNPFEDNAEDDEDGLGITIIRSITKSCSYTYENGRNMIYMEM